jgi:hypothetical protein
MSKLIHLSSIWLKTSMTTIMDRIISIIASLVFITRLYPPHMILTFLHTQQHCTPLLAATLIFGGHGSVAENKD